MQQFRHLIVILLLALTVIAHAGEDIAHAIIVKVNGSPINKEDIRLFISEYAIANNLVEPNSNTIDPELASKLAEDAIRVLIREKIIRQEAVRMGIGISYEMVDDYLVKYDIPDNKLNRRQTEVDMLFDMVLQKVGIAVLEPSPKEIRKIFNDNQNIFQLPRMIRAHQIMIPKSSEDLKELDEQEAQRIRTELLKPKADFKEVAKLYCSSPVARQRGGLMVPPGSEQFGAFFPPAAERFQTIYPKAILDELAALPVQTVSKIIETEKAYHILWIDIERKAMNIPFNKVSNRIMHFIRRRERAIKQREWLVDIIKRSNIIWHNDKPVESDYCIPPVPEFSEKDIMGLK